METKSPDRDHSSSISNFEIARIPSQTIVQARKNNDEITDHVISFFSHKLYNSCEATEELIKKIEATQNEALATKALALYQDHYASLERPYDHVTFMYGLGMLYMHFNAYSWAVKAFRDAIYMQPSFARSRDVHTRLGLIFKATGRHKLSERHFNLAINDTRNNSGTMTRLELQFHFAHLSEIQGRLKQAKEAYERLLQENDLPQQLSANIQRQLGLMYSNNSLDLLSNSIKQNMSNQANHKMETALNYLNTSNRTYSDPKTSYYLGRCFTNIGKYQDAFASYRSMIDREESTADTWCSIGVLYHRQNQPTDALQAYIRSVQFDKQHSVSWMNLGLLYESHRQFNDALKCYQHALRSSSEDVDKSLQTRMKFIQKQMSEFESSLGNINKSKLSSDKLLCLEDLWNLESKISSEHSASSCNNNKNSSNTTNNNNTYKNHNDITYSNSSIEIKPDCAQVSSQQDLNHRPAKEVIETCRNSSNPKRIDVNLLTDEFKPPYYFTQAPPYPSLPSNRLTPSTPSIFLETKKDLVSKKLQEYCQSNPISLVRNIATVLKLDLGLFSTKTLVESNPEHEVNISTHNHNQTDCDDINEPEFDNWSYDFQTSKNSIARYASYQVASFRESLQEERESKPSTSKSNPTKHEQSETDSNESASQMAKRLSVTNHTMITTTSNCNQISNQSTIDLHNNNNGTTNLTMNNGNNSISPSHNLKGSPAAKRIRKDSQKQKRVMAADYIDLFDEKKWRPQLNELNKLPSFLRCVSASNMLTHVGSIIPGVNTIQMSMHVPGCRILEHIKPNNLCSININVGPGDYEWFAVPADYTSILSRLCNRFGYDLENRNWWPKLSDLQKHNIPIYRFSQRPGDLVWINSGTITFVRAIGWCNNIYWNVGPLGVKQYRSAAESFELDKYLSRKSAVPMIQLTWNIVININILFDDELHDQVVGVLRRSLKFCNTVKELIEETKQAINEHNRELEPKAARYCSLCDCEVFNIYFIHKVDGSLNCVECARRMEQGFNEFDINQDYDLKYLMKLYDDFIETKRRFESRNQQKSSSATYDIVKN